jgi:hypothetical protein
MSVYGATLSLTRSAEPPPALPLKRAPAARVGGGWARGAASGWASVAGRGGGRGGGATAGLARAKKCTGTICKGADLTGRWPVSTMSTFRPRRTASTPAAPASRGTVVGLWGHRGAWRWSLSARDLYPHSHRRRPQPRQSPGEAHGPTPCPHNGAAERGHPTARTGR